jgi:hypothetical protein
VRLGHASQRHLSRRCQKRPYFKDGWTITHDPLRLSWGGKDAYVDFGAEQLLAAEKAGKRIALEVKSFVGDSEMDDLEKALGQYTLYHDLLAELEPDRVLYLAVPEKFYWISLMNLWGGYC